jgi:hypothetical protein
MNGFCIGQARSSDHGGCSVALADQAQSEPAQSLRAVQYEAGPMQWSTVAPVLSHFAFGSRKCNGRRSAGLQQFEQPRDEFRGTCIRYTPQRDDRVAIAGATFRIRLPADGSRDHFELDWGEVRSYARRVKE